MSNVKRTKASSNISLGPGLITSKSGILTRPVTPGSPLRTVDNFTNLEDLSRRFQRLSSNILDLEDSNSKPTSGNVGAGDENGGKEVQFSSGRKKLNPDNEESQAVVPEEEEEVEVPPPRSPAFTDFSKVLEIQSTSIKVAYFDPSELDCLGGIKEVYTCAATSTTCYHTTTTTTVSSTQPRGILRNASECNLREIEGTVPYNNNNNNNCCDPCESDNTLWACTVEDDEEEEECECPDDKCEDNDDECPSESSEEEECDPCGNSRPRTPCTVPYVERPFYTFENACLYPELRESCMTNRATTPLFQPFGAPPMPMGYCPPSGPPITAGSNVQGDPCGEESGDPWSAQRGAGCAIPCSAPCAYPSCDPCCNPCPCDPCCNPCPCDPCCAPCDPCANNTCCGPFTNALYTDRSNFIRFADPCNESGCADPCANPCYPAPCNDPCYDPCCNNSNQQAQNCGPRPPTSNCYPNPPPSQANNNCYPQSARNPNNCNFIGQIPTSYLQAPSTTTARNNQPLNNCCNPPMATSGYGDCRTAGVYPSDCHKNFSSYSQSYGRAQTAAGFKVFQVGHGPLVPPRTAQNMLYQMGLHRPMTVNAGTDPLNVPYNNNPGMCAQGPEVFPRRAPLPLQPPPPPPGMENPYGHFSNNCNFFIYNVQGEGVGAMNGNDCDPVTTAMALSSNLGDPCSNNLPSSNGPPQAPNFYKPNLHPVPCAAEIRSMLRPFRRFF